MESPVEGFTLTNAQGMEVRVITLGCALVSIRVPDRKGHLDDVILGFDTPDGYRQNAPYFGVVVGRYANRIAGGHFTLDGVTYDLAINNSPNHLHGGIHGFHRAVWECEAVKASTGTGLVFHHTSPDGDEGYPGVLEARVTYILTDANALSIEYHATTDKATPVNLTQHAYFNLAGEGNGSVLDHEACIHADRFTPVDETLIPTGVLANVEGTPFDFRKPAPIGAAIDALHEQIHLAGGYDHNFVLNRSAAGLVPAARIVEPRSGRALEVATTEPGLQFYTANNLQTAGKSGHVYGRHSGFCLETQHFPDSPNRPEFPSSILRPGDTYRSQTVFAFGVLP